MTATASNTKMCKKGRNNDVEGRIDISQLNTPPEKHEYETAKYFAVRGKDVVFIKPSSIPEVHRPDILMDGVEWEIKSPKGSSKRTIENNFRDAVKQSYSIIFDLRRVRIPEDQSIAKLRREFEARPKMQRLLIIKKNQGLIEIRK